MYVDLAGLARYKSDFDAWARGALLPKDAAFARVRTAKAGAVSFYPVQETPLDVSVDFMFSETPPASGDKSPTNPSTISGVSSVKVTRCGKNLCPLVGDSSSSYISVSFTDDGEFVFNGSYVGFASVYVFNKPNNKNLFPDYLERGKTYTFSLQGDNSSVIFRVYRYYTNNYGGAVVSIAPGESRTYTIPDTQSMILRFEIPANTVLNNAKFKLQIEEGSSATEFEPYAGTDYTLPLGSTYYGGGIDLATGLMTVTHEAIVFDGTEIWFLAAPVSNQTVNLFYIRIGSTNPHPYGNSIAADECCTHFNYNSASVPNIPAIRGTRSFVYLSFDQPDVATLKSWLATQYSNGTPMVFVYGLETPYSIQLAPAQILSLSQPDKYVPRLNTVYSDQSAVQVGYLKHPSAASSELRNALVSLGGGI